jgi:flagellum-specific peptidoglycan hydrolase FlgJ
MRNQAIVATCVLLVAALVSPGVAMAKGGNGQHSEATHKASGTGKPAAAKDKASKPKAAKKPRKSTEPKVAHTQKATSSRDAKRPARGEPKMAAAKKTKLKRKPQSVAPEHPASTASSVEAIPISLPSTGLAEASVPSDTIGTSDNESHGVLDTIRLQVNAAIAGLRATVAARWATLTS